MWAIKGRDGQGNTREVKFTEVASASRAAILEKFRGVMEGEIPEPFLRELEQPDPIPGVDGIEYWGERASELVGRDRLIYGPFLKTMDGRDIPALTMPEAEALAFHYPEALVADVSGLRDLEISAPPGPPPGRETGSGMILESRIYSGGGVVESESQSDAETPAFNVPHSGNRGGLIARIAHWIARPFETSTDPFMHGRLRHYEDRFPFIAKNYPDISLAATDAGLFRAIHKAPAGTAVIVFVHGTYSCAVPHLALLHPLKLPAYRFEHDTFRPPAENKNRLAQAVRDFIPKGARLYLVAHSRGGLVARLAARDLLSSYDVQVLTFGTPHQGTPLANAGKRILTALLASGRAALLAGGGVAANAVFAWDPPSLAGKLLLKGILPSKFPEGLDAMRPDSGFIGALGSWEPFLLRTWGAQCEIDKLPAGAFAFAIREAIKGAFAGAANDTVVGAASATAAGIAQAVLPACTHFQYFSRPDVCGEIRSLS